MDPKEETSGRLAEASPCRCSNAWRRVAPSPGAPPPPPPARDVLPDPVVALAVAVVVGVGGNS